MAISDWSTTAADNDDADIGSGIDWREGMAPGQVNNTGRAMMAVLRTWYDSITSSVATALAFAPKGHISGLTLSNNTLDANNDIDIAAGEASSDASSPTRMTLSAALTKRLDAAWSVGTGNGGLDTGAKANSTWYHVWLIKRSDPGVVDALFSASATSPTMPANYDHKRRIGAVVTDSSGNIRAFAQNGDRVDWVSVPLDVDVSNLGTAATLYPLTVPSGLKVVARMNVQTIKSGAIPQVYVYNPAQSAPVNLGSSGVIATVRAAVAGLAQPNGYVEVVTDTSSQVRAVASEAGVSFLISTIGYLDTRGRL